MLKENVKKYLYRLWHFYPGPAYLAGVTITFEEDLIMLWYDGTSIILDPWFTLSNLDDKQKKIIEIIMPDLVQPVQVDYEYKRAFELADKFFDIDWRKFAEIGDRRYLDIHVGILPDYDDDDDSGMRPESYELKLLAYRPPLPEFQMYVSLNDNDIIYMSRPHRLRPYVDTIKNMFRDIYGYDVGGD